jgi:hypothetical protein
LFQLRTSERKTFKRCPQRWEWAYVRGFKPLRDATPLWFGQAVHVALADWYLKGNARGPHPAETFDKALEGNRILRIRPDSETDEQEFIDARALGIEMLNNYVETYGRDDEWDVIATEQEFHVALSNLDGTRRRWLQYKGTIDGIYRSNADGRIRLMEHKTAASINLNFLPLDDQAGSYWAFSDHILRSLGMLDTGGHVQGINYNFLRKAQKDTRPRNISGHYCNKPIKKHYIDALEGVGGGTASQLSKMKLEDLAAFAASHHVVVLGDVSKIQPDPLFIRHDVFRDEQERAIQIQRIKQEAHYMDRMRARNPEFPVYKNPTKDCSWDCAFFRMCQLHEQGTDDWEDFAAGMFRVGDPYDNFDGPEGVKSS